MTLGKDSSAEGSVSLSVKHVAMSQLNGPIPDHKGLLIGSLVIAVPTDTIITKAPWRRSSLEQGLANF